MRRQFVLDAGKNGMAVEVIAPGNASADECTRKITPYLAGYVLRKSFRENWSNSIRSLWMVLEKSNVVL
jgi:hypothetical protein